MGDFPMMTDQGTFIINGTERVVVSQLVRSPGVYFHRELDKTSDKDVYIAKIIPSPRGVAGVRRRQEGHRRRPHRPQAPADRHRAPEGAGLDRRRDPRAVRQRPVHPAHAREGPRRDAGGGPRGHLPQAPSRASRPRPSPRAPSSRTCSSTPSATTSRASAGTRSTRSSARPRAAPLAAEGAQQAAGRGGQRRQEGLGPGPVPRLRRAPEGREGRGRPKYKAILAYEDILKTVRYLVKLHAGEEGYDPDDIDHFGNRRLRSVGELIQNQIRIGLSRMERVVKERMTTQDVEAITPQTLINIRPVVASIKEFFGTSQLSQFMDQTNPLAGPHPQAAPLGPRARAVCRVSAPGSRSATSTRPTTAACARSRRPRVRTSASSARSRATGASTSSGSSRPRTAAS